jgi:hypothetical protein
LLSRPSSGVEEEADEALGNQHSGLFAKDLPWLMYGYGDADKPLEVRCPCEPWGARGSCMHAGVLAGLQLLFCPRRVVRTNVVGFAAHHRHSAHTFGCHQLQETVNLVEDIALQFITDTVHAAMRAAAVRTGGAMW